MFSLRAFYRERAELCELCTMWQYDRDRVKMTVMVAMVAMVVAKTVATLLLGARLILDSLLPTRTNFFLLLQFQAMRFILVTPKCATK